MLLNVKCPSCGKTYSVPEDAAGKTARCRNCGQVMQLPGRAAPATPEPEPEPLYTCATCGRKFAVEDVYDQQGQVICKGCFGRLTSQAAPAGSDTGALACGACGAALDPADAEPVDGRMLCAGCAMTAAAEAALVPASGSQLRRRTRRAGYGGWIVGGTVAAAVVGVAVIVMTRARNPQLAPEPPAGRAVIAHNSTVPQAFATLSETRPTVGASGIDWEQANRSKVTALRKEAIGRELAGDYKGADSKFRELFELAKGANELSPGLRQELADAHNSWDAVQRKLTAAGPPPDAGAPSEPASAQQAEPQPAVSNENWEHEHRTQIEQLLKLAQARWVAKDTFRAALAYQQLFDVIGTHLADIRDPSLKKQVDAAAAQRVNLLGQVKASPEAVTLTADALVSSGLEALERRQWRAGLESFADVRMLFDRNVRSAAERVKNRQYLLALHGLAVAYMRTKQMPKAGELFAGESDPLCQQIVRDPTRPLVINRAVVDITQKTKAVRAARTLKEYLEKHPGEADETMVNLLGTAIAVGEEHTTARSFLNQCAEFYVKLNEQLEKTRPGQKRWGVQWLDEGEAQRKFDEKRKALQEAQRLTQQTNAAFNEWERQKQLYQPSGPDRLRHTSKANVDAAETRFLSLQGTAEEARKNVPTEPWLTDLEPVLPVPRRMQVAELQPTDPASTALNPPTAQEPATPTAVQEAGTTGTVPETPAAPAPTAVAVQRRALAFAIDGQRLVTSSEVIGDATVVRLKDAQGTGFNAQVVGKQELFALLQMEPAELAGRSLAYFNIASSFTGGAVRCSAIPDENIFGPEPKLLAGQGSAPPAQGEWYVSLSDHPRLPGSPLLNANNEIVGVVFPVTRDDPRTHLRCSSLKQLRDFLSANSALPRTASANPEPLSVYEVTVQE